jgi:predicted tellurium resistance membrane protein TerC
VVEALIAFLALTIMEIVLGIDNIVFISIQTAKLPPEQRARARWLGLGLAMGARIMLLLAINWIMGLTEPAFHLSSLGIASEWLRDGTHDEIDIVSWKDLILLGGGLFLLNSSVREIHHKMEGASDGHHTSGTGVTMTSVMIQIGLLDIIFSLDSVITAVGMVHSGEGGQATHEHGLTIMVSAIVLAVLVMMFFAGPVSAFVEKHPTVKMLALSFLLLIGVMLIAEGIGSHIEKGYIYFAMGFSLMVEFFNLRADRKRKEFAQQLKEHAVIEAGK